jgi:hypothetical protein
MIDTVKDEIPPMHFYPTNKEAKNSINIFRIRKNHAAVMKSQTNSI